MTLIDGQTWSVSIFGPRCRIGPENKLYFCMCEALVIFLFSFWRSVVSWKLINGRASEIAIAFPENRLIGGEVE